MAVATYTAVASRSYNDGGYWNDYTGSQVYLDVWQSDTGLGQGRYAKTFDPYAGIEGPYDGYDGPFYGTFHFGSGSGKPTTLSGKVIDSARLRLTRCDDAPGSDSGVTTTVYATVLTSVPAAGVHSPDGQVSGAGTTSPAMTKGQAVWFSIPVVMAQAVINGYCLCLYTGNSRLSRHYGIESATYKPAIEITYHELRPTLTTPSISSIGPITMDDYTFAWSASSDTSGYLVPADLLYEMQISVDGGDGWRTAVYTTSAGVTQYKIDSLRAAGVLQDSAMYPDQYYYNPICKICVRAISPPWGSPATVYSSAWAVSSAFMINYKKTLGAPSSLVASKPDPYEGETVTFTVGLPSGTAYNSHDHTGAVMNLTYAVEIAQDPASPITLITDSALVTEPQKVISYTVKSLTTEKDNRTEPLRVKCTDKELQVSPYCAAGTFTIQRFQNPSIEVTNVERAETSTLVHIKVLDTGFGATQGVEQLRENGATAIEYSFSGVIFTVASLGTWVGLTNSFTVSTPSATDTYSLTVRVTNNPPSGLPEKKGTDKFDIMAYLPGFMVWKRSGASDPAAIMGAYTQALIMGDDPGAPVNKGCLAVQYDIDAGGSIRAGGSTVWSQSTLPVTAAGIALLDDTSVSAQRTTLGLGTAAVANIGTGASDVATGNHSHANGTTLDAADITWANGWTDYGGSYGFRILKDYDGTIHLRGLIKSGTVGSLAFTLPSGYRPSSVGGYFSVASYSGYGALRILADGSVTVYAGSSSWTSVDGISFR